MIHHRLIRSLIGAALFVMTAIHGSVAGAAAPLQKVVFVFAGFNERTGYVFVKHSIYPDDRGA